MESQGTELELRDLVKRVKIEFKRSFTVAQFIDEIKEKTKVFDAKRDQKTVAANMAMMNSYVKEMESGLHEHLYEFELTFGEKKVWRLSN